MTDSNTNRREFLRGLVAAGTVAASGPLQPLQAQVAQLVKSYKGSGDQRLALARLRQWESWGYGMFLCFGMSTWVRSILQDSAALATYSPAKLDVDQWLRVARDAGMKYAVLTAKHVDGLALWPSKHTSYSIANARVKTDIVGAFVTACRKYGIQPVMYYCSWDNHHRFGSLTPSQTRITEAFTTSFYQDFQTAQITELITQYGKLAGMWVNIPQVLGRSYRSFLYEHIARRQPDCVIMMNSGIGDGSEYKIPDAWPSDLIAMNRYLPPDSGHVRWREIEGKVYYMPGEVVDTLGKEYFFAPDDPPRPDDELKRLYVETRRRGANLLLAVQPNQDGFIPKDRHDALVRLRKNAAIS